MAADGNQFRRNGNSNFLGRDRADIEPYREHARGRTRCAARPSSRSVLKIPITLRFDPIIPM